MLLWVLLHSLRLDKLLLTRLNNSFKPAPVLSRPLTLRSSPSSSELSLSWMTHTVASTAASMICAAWLRKVWLAATSSPPPGHSILIGPRAFTPLSSDRINESGQIRSRRRELCLLKSEKQPGRMVLASPNVQDGTCCLFTSGSRQVTSDIFCWKATVLPSK